MTHEFKNPMGLNGFSFLEFSGPETSLFKEVFTRLGFTPVAQHRTKDATLYRQGDIQFILNDEPQSKAAEFAEEHGGGACAMGFRVHNAEEAFHRAVDLGAEPVEVPCSPSETPLKAIRGIGGSLLYLMEENGDLQSPLETDFAFFEDVEKYPVGLGLHTIDHLTHNVFKGRMDHWADFYEKIFGFKEIRFFDIQGKHTGLVSRAMSAPDGKIRIPLNEEGDGEAGQIEEFLREFNGEGIQHIALATDDIVSTVDALRKKGVVFMSAPPDTYYELLEERLPGHGEKVDALHTRGILLDGSTEDGKRRLLLQIFTECMVGPLFIEIIQRKGDEGFGEGNFQALFEAMERDQIRRGQLNISDPLPEGNET